MFLDNSYDGPKIASLLCPKFQLRSRWVDRLNLKLFTINLRQLLKRVTSFHLWIRVSEAESYLCDPICMCVSLAYVIIHH